MLTWIESSADTLEAELAIVNSNPFFNRISYDKEELSLEELRQEIEESIEAGAERYVFLDEGKPVGILEYLMNNPHDGYPWLGLLEIHAGLQGEGYGPRALEKFYSIIRSRGVNVFRIGVLLDNEPAHRFWKKQGFVEVEKKPWRDKQVMVYERECDARA